MKLRYLFISTLALMAVSCQDDTAEGGGNPGNPTPGQEVQFGGTLQGTRTIYGDINAAGTAYPIYWVNGDQVQIWSPQAASGFDSRAYSVAVDGAMQNYATSLTKASDTGVRWGEAATANFYSVYPASSVVASTVGAASTSVTVNLHVEQDLVVANDNSSAAADMSACLMYGQEYDAPSGQVVNFNYKPYSTALRFRVQGPSQGMGAPASVTIRRIDINAPKAIAGNFTMTFSGSSTTAAPTVAAVQGSSSQQVVLFPTYSNSAFLTLSTGQSVEVNAFIMLDEQTTLDGTWSISITDDLGNVYTKSLKNTATEGSSNVLIPGQIHYLGSMPNIDRESEEWDVTKWMTYLPRNVYLSEISIPGSWNSLNGGAQTNTSITYQYNAGVRAFHLDARWRAKRSLGWGGYSWSDWDLSVANNGATYNYSTIIGGGLFSDTKVMRYSAAESFSTYLKQITDCVMPDEYLLVYCTFAQGSYDYDETGGWEKAISVACATNDAVIDASTIDANTVVADVLGKVIVIVNTDDNAINIPESKCLFMHMSMTLDEATYTGYLNQGTYYTPALSYGSGTASGITVYGTHAQYCGNETASSDGTRGYLPSLAQRQEMGNNILNWSMANYAQDNYAHNDWIYLGLGGYYDDGGERYDMVAANLNTWIDGKVANMAAQPTGDQSAYYPVGIVLMNNAVDYSAVAKNILQLNNKYQKAHDANRSPINGDPVAGIDAYSVSDGPVSTGGNVINP